MARAKRNHIVKRFLLELLNTALLVLGVLSAGMGLKGFPLSGADGGLVRRSILN